MMEDHVFLEIDEGSIHLTQARVGRRKVELQAQALLELPAHDISSIIFGIHDLLSDVKPLGKKSPTVHVAISDNRFVQFPFDLPAIEPDQVLTLLKREARRIGNIAGTEDVLLGYRKLGKRKRGTQRVSVVAIRELTLRPILEEIQLEGYSIGTVTSQEEASLRHLPFELPSSAILVDCGKRRLRFIFVEDGVVTLRRQVYLTRLHEGDEDDLTDEPGEDESDDSVEEPASSDQEQSLDEQVVKDLHRFMKSLKGMNKSKPQALVVSPRIALSKELAKTLGESLELFSLADYPIAQSPDANNMGTATVGMIRSVQACKGLSVYYTKKPSRLKKRLIAFVVVSIMLLLTGVVLTGRAIVKKGQLDDQMKTVKTNMAWNKSKEQSLLRPASERDFEILGPLEQSVFNLRLPVSLFVGQLSASVPDGIELQNLHIKRDGTIEILGTVNEPAAVQSLQKIRRLRDSLRDFVYLRDVTERIGEFKSGTAPLKFSLEAQWNREAK